MTNSIGVRILPESSHDEVSTFNDETLFEYVNYALMDELSRRSAIWAHIQNNLEIPKALKPFVLDCLNQPFKGKKALKAEHDRLVMMRDILLTQLNENKTLEKAAEKLASKYHKDPETLIRYYKNIKYSLEKKSIKSAYQQTSDKN